MSWPVPQPGLVIRYAYLWRREALAGQEEGVKDRPCAVVLAHQDEDGETRVYVLPVTHSAPDVDTEAVEIPTPGQRRLGLDEGRSWIVVNEANVFTWPGPDLRFLPGKGLGGAAYGFLPPALFKVVRDRFLERARRRQADSSAERNSALRSSSRKATKRAKMASRFKRSSCRSLVSAMGMSPDPAVR